MFCRNCGTEVDDQVTVCPQCGNKTDVVENKEEKVKSPLPINLVEIFENIIKNKMMLGGIGILVLVLIVFIIIWMQPKKFNLEDYVRISYSGYDGYAKAYAVLDENALYQDLCEAKGLSSDMEDYKSLEQLDSALNNAYALDACIESIKLNIFPNTNIANGDELVAEISYDNELAKAQKIKFKGKSVKETVEGLKPIVEIDPFADLDVTFSGIAPEGNVEFAYSGNNEYISDYSFKAKPLSGLKNGDIVTISLEADEEETLSYGFIATRREQQYEVSGLDELADTYTDLAEDLLEKLKSEAEDVIYSYTGNRYDSNTSMSSLTYAGYIMNIEKANGCCVNNELYLVYKGAVSNVKNQFETMDVYYPVGFSGIMISDGMFDYYSTKAIVGYSNFGDSWMGTEGYVNPVMCHMEIAWPDNEYCTSECGDGFEVYAKYEWVTKLDDIDSEYRTVLYADAKDIVESYVENDYYNDFRAEEPEEVGEYLLTAKEPNSQYLQNNKYSIVYSAIVSHDKNWFEPTRVYFPVEYDGIMKLGNSEYMVFGTPHIVGSSTFPESYSTTRGFVDGKQMFDKVINAERGDYIYELSEGLKEFEE